MRIAVMSMAHHHAESYISILKGRNDVEVTGLSDEDTERGKGYARSLGVPWFDNYRSLLAEKPDAVLICSENNRHMDDVRMAAEAGAAILCEKPVATSLADGLEIERLCREHSVLFMLAFPLPFSPAFTEIQGMLDSGRLGRIHCINGRNQGQMPAHHRKWFVDAGIAGGGALIDHTVHLADLYRRLLRTEPVEVYARANRILHRDAVQVETGGFLMLSFPDGCFASLDFSWSRPAHYPSWGGLSLELVSDAGVIDMDAFRQKFDIYGAREQHYRTDFWGSDINALMIDEFIDAVRSKREPRVNIRDAVEALRVVDGAYRSLESGRPCAIP